MLYSGQYTAWQAVIYRDEKHPEFAPVLCCQRFERGLSQEALAERADISGPLSPVIKQEKRRRAWP